jgi:hypothetical protein
MLNMPRYSTLRQGPLQPEHTWLQVKSLTPQRTTIVRDSNNLHLVRDRSARLLGVAEATGLYSTDEESSRGGRAPVYTGYRVKPGAPSPGNYPTAKGRKYVC